ncbi:hypothetical protein [Streptomyces sp. NPDC090021]|uniref:hypothetical protein n=1 Tax=Streptomyces sp. NPDC090021 TaxID=3365919 RepID=UPI00380B3010
MIWFAASSDPRIVDPILKKDTLTDLPGGAGGTDRDLNAAALKCGDKMVYFGMRWSDEYRSAVSDRGVSVSHEMFQSFIDSAGNQYKCGAVQLLSN